MSKQELRIIQEGGNVRLVLNERTSTIMPWQLALEVAQELHNVAKLAEATDPKNANLMIADQNFLNKSGIPINILPESITKSKKKPKRTIIKHS